ncbi:hypothetical protein TcG_11473 [Trypanosoma cruzi]|nr:hypothetical protein TcG_11473 [Trypanosoma cruzi]
MHTTCKRTAATTARGCQPPSTVLVGANNNSNVVDAEGSLTHSAPHGPAPLWQRRHRTHLTIIHARISSLTQTHKSGKGIRCSHGHTLTPQIIHATTAAHHGKFQHNRKECNYMLYGKSPQFTQHKRTMTLPFSLHSPFIFPMRNPADVAPPW